jgi:hypothetical protein
MPDARDWNTEQLTSYLLEYGPHVFGTFLQLLVDILYIKRGAITVSATARQSGSRGDYNDEQSC